MAQFGKIMGKLWTSSKKWRRLQEDPATCVVPAWLPARFLYLYLHTSPHHKTGTYVLPMRYAVQDLGLEEAEIRRHLEALVKVGLVVYDEDEEVVHLTGWVSQDGPCNHRHWLGIAHIVGELPSGRCKQACLQELEQSPHRPAAAATEAPQDDEEEPSDDEEAEGDDGGDRNAAQELEEPKPDRGKKRQKHPPSEAAHRCLKAWTDLYPITGSAAKPAGEARSLDTLDKMMRLDHVPEEDVVTVCQWAAREWAPRGMIGSPAALRERTRAGDRTKWEFILHQARNGRHAGPGQEGRAVGAQWEPDAPRNREAYE